MIKSCEYEDINKADCINCFNGLPVNKCKRYEEMEGKKLRQMVHERAERDRKKVYNNAIDDFIKECDKYCGYYAGKNRNLTRNDMLNIAEQLKAGGKNEMDN